MEEFVLTVNKEQLNVISAALGELPFKYANPVVIELNRQIVMQLESIPENNELLASKED